MSCDIWQAQAVTDVNFALSFLFLSIYYVRLVGMFVYFVSFVIFCYHMFGEIKL